MVSGYWNPLGHQDNYNYGGGPDPGDFSGLPITDAARKAAQQYDADEFEMPELMCRPFMATYAPRTLSTMRIWDTTDPQTQEQTKIETTMAFADPHRDDLDARVQSSVSVTHRRSIRWQGYSTGKWVGNVLWVHTDHLKQGYLQRSQGLLLSDQDDHGRADLPLRQHPGRHHDDLRSGVPVAAVHLQQVVRVHPPGKHGSLPVLVHNQVPSSRGVRADAPALLHDQLQRSVHEQGHPARGSARAGSRRCFPSIRTT